MNTSYAAWAQYDVDDALARVDLLEQQEQIAREKQHNANEKRRVEETISKDAEQSAEVLAAQAAVAALRAKGRSRGSKRPVPESTSKAQETDIEAVALRARAALMQQKHARIKDTMASRRRGDALLEKRDWDAAKRAYETALASAKELEVMVPQLMELQQRLDTRPPTNENQQHDGDEHDHDGCCGDHDHSHDHSHDHARCAHSKPQVFTPEALPQKDDLGAVVKMFLKDCFMGIGACEMGSGHYAAASEAFKEVLVRDDTHLAAWLQRGRAFEALDAPLLAWLHYSRVTTLDPGFEDAKECEERIDDVLLRGVATRSNDAYVSSPTTLKGRLHRVKLQMDAGNVIMIEGFFEYAITKYEAAINALAAVRTEHHPTGIQETVVTKLETTCHLNIASCYLEMQKHLPLALKHCQLALDNDPGHIVANFRLAQIHRAMHAYESALESYHTVRMLVAYLPPEEAAKQLNKLDDEMDKCHFERSQYDTAFIRQELQKEAGM